MNVIVFNNTTRFELENFNKTTSFESDRINSSAYLSLITTDIDELAAFAQNIITSIQILHDNEVIYNSINLNAKITSINEYLNGDRINININMNFSEV